MPTQKDVAKEAKVSSASVSRYLANINNVSDVKAKRIQEAIDKLNYRIDFSAQVLKTGRYYQIGILCPGKGPFYWEITSSIQYALNDAGYFSTVLLTRNIDGDKANSPEIIKSFFNKKHIDGVIFFPQLTKEDDDILDNLIKIKENFVIVDQYYPNLDVPQVNTNNYKAAKQAAIHLCKLNHREFICIKGFDNDYSSHERFRGYQDGLREFGIELTEDRIINGEYQAKVVYTYAKNNFFTLPNFTAVLASSDQSAIGFLKAAYENGKTCPKDFSIIGFDNNEEYTPYTTPSLSTFDQNTKQIGLKATELLIQLIEGEEIKNKIVTIEPQFILRESVRALN